jgi:hypothetical protein
MRVSSDGELILLEEQDRNLWHREQIKEGTGLTESVLRSGAASAYAVQAPIAGPPSSAVYRRISIGIRTTSRLPFRLQVGRRSKTLATSALL